MLNDNDKQRIWSRMINEIQITSEEVRKYVGLIKKISPVLIELIDFCKDRDGDFESADIYRLEELSKVITDK